MTKITELEIIDVLKQCFDPEIPIDLWSLGLIYSIKIINNPDGRSNVNIIMTLTTPGCSMGNVMAEDIKTKLEIKDSIASAIIEVTFDPPWEAHMMSDDARTKLGFSNKDKVINEPSDTGNWE